MSAPVKLGRIWSVPIRGAYSLLLLVLLLTGMAWWQFSAISGGHSQFSYALAALFSAVLFVWTVFAHEAAHIVAARRYGAKVNGVTLSFRGGETAISGQPAVPRQGVVVALAGPAVSLVCGVLCGAVAFGAAALGTPSLLALSLAWTGVLSILVGAANLIPVAPLDGGHVLQAAVWWGTHNRVRASAVAGFAGQVVGAAVLLWGAWLALDSFSPIAAVATLLVAWPLWRGASATRRAAQQRAHLGGVAVRELMRDAPRTLSVQLPAAEAAALIATFDRYVAVVDDAGRPRRLVSVERIARAARSRPDRPLGRIARRGALVTATADEPVADVLERTYATPKPVLVMAGGEPAGLLDPDDIRAALETHRAVGPSAAAVEPADVWPGRPVHGNAAA